MLKEYPKFERGAIEDFYKTISKDEKDFLEKYLQYRKARGITTQEKILDIRRYLLHLRYILDKDLRKMDLNDLRGILGIINGSRLTTYVKNSVKTDLKNFLKYSFKDWSNRFNELDDIKLKAISRNEEKINPSKLLHPPDIKKIMDHENKTFFKAFFMTQYEAGLRTGETRNLKWDNIKFDIDKDGISQINLFASKTQKARTTFIKDAAFYLKKLKHEQDNTAKSIFVFPSKADQNQPIDKATISSWMRKLTKKAIGRKVWSYMLRHSRADELYQLAENNKISKDVAAQFMGHSEKMYKVYRHPTEDQINLLKKQVYNLEDELPEKEKHELQKQIDELRDALMEQGKVIKQLAAARERNKKS